MDNTKNVKRRANPALKDGVCACPLDQPLDLSVKGDIVVGNDVWFGYDSLVLPGAKIGDGAIVATRAVVVKDVPPYSIVAGNPGKIVKMRFDDRTIERLLRIAW